MNTYILDVYQTQALNFFQFPLTDYYILQTSHFVLWSDLAPSKKAQLPNDVSCCIMYILYITDMHVMNMCILVLQLCCQMHYFSICYKIDFV